MSIEETREAARRALFAEGMIDESDRLIAACESTFVEGRLAAVRRAIRRGIDHQIETPAMVALCRLYVAEHEEASR